ncbi:DNA gyrase inhibitor YacG [Azospirillum cavernae]|uniref:DNA gyrase inhibitor YacG n=1 Tax=Azospirillum cavernae TaxID=2320860 RepID=A0A418VRT5_9PROT|nr:DNA gyrase inhibitor YacG [Azospirillum cavernae]RJF79190.1 DNA gyrase inhibitor YacG [Azospirillum cavernae]
MTAFLAPSALPPCPICGRAAEPTIRPFCSKRCADVDLGRWLGGVYRVETPEGPDESGENAPSEDA